jgi:DNA-directed RNA polymerase specialized sigma24 family protein
MKEMEISKRLRAISMAEWESVIKKCYGHMRLKLINKTLTGAHCEQRLGMVATDFYVGSAYKALFEGSWQWQFEKYDLPTQMIRIINSLISNEVRKYKAEQKQNRQLPLLRVNDEFENLEDEETEYNSDESINFKKCAVALAKACSGKPHYEEFIKLKKEGKPLKEISEIMQCTIDDAYQMMETIARRARKILTEQTN